MATLDTIELRTKPRYWTAAVWQKVPGRGLIFQGYMPAVNASWPKFLDRLMQLPKDRQTRSYYWHEGKWLPDHNAVIGGLVTIGALQRANPLPPGRYWQDIFNKQAGDWNAWIVEHGSLEIGDTSKDVVVEKVDRFRADPLRDGSWLPELLAPENAGTIPDRMWVLFRVQRPVPWPATKLGFPTIADETVQSSADTADVPPGPTPGEEIESAAMHVVRPVMYLAGSLALLKLLWALRK